VTGQRCCAIIGLLVISRAASAAPGFTESSTRGAQVPDWLEGVPAQCRRYAEIPAYTPDVFAWNQMLSLAACVQEPSLAHVADPEQLNGMVDELFAGIAPSMLIYLDALAHAPGPMQLRAAYHVALAHVALVTRARLSILPPPDSLATAVVSTAPRNRASALRYHELQTELEPLLDGAMQTARIALIVIDRAATADPSLAPDAVTRNMVTTARAMLERWPASPNDLERREPPDQPPASLTQRRAAAAVPGRPSHPPP